jgi:hypothetical protein
VYLLYERASFWKGLITDPFARADGVVVGGDPSNGADRLAKALCARPGARATIIGGFFFTPAKVVERIGRAGRGMYVTTLDLPGGVLPLSAAGRRFKRDIGEPATQSLGVMEAAQAAELVMDAIARSDGTRASVLEGAAGERRARGHPRQLPLRP